MSYSPIAPNRAAIVAALFDSVNGRTRATTRDGAIAVTADICRALRATDPKWGMNWKRGNIGDFSTDVLAYPNPSGAFGVTHTGNVELYDVIAGAEGPSPSAAWSDVTQVTIDAGVSAGWVSPPSGSSPIPGPPPIPGPTSGPTLHVWTIDEWPQVRDARRTRLNDPTWEPDAAWVILQMARRYGFGLPPGEAPWTLAKMIAHELSA